MNSLELRGYIGNIRLQQIKGQKTKEQAISDLQSIDWNNIEEFPVCPISSLQSIVTNYISELNQ